MSALYEAVAARRLEGHYAPLFGATLRALAVAWEPCARLYLFVAVRQVLSAAVRLGLAGPHEAARMQAELSSVLDAVATECQGLALEDAAQTAPRFDLYAAMHNRLDGRLFQS